MNLILTSRCNKNCGYCFAKDIGLEDMSLEQVEKTLDDHEGMTLRMLGGEPTMHPQFRDMLLMAVRKERHVHVFSNLLFDDSVRESIQEAGDHTVVRVLANATCLNCQPGRLEKWLANWNALVGRVTIMRPGLTLVPGKDYVSYLDMLLGKIKTPDVRVSLAMPTRDEHLGDTRIGDQLLKLKEVCERHGSTMTLDCMVYPCMFREPHPELTRTKCEQIPADIFADFSVSYCFPTRKKLTTSYGPGMLDELRKLYDELMAETMLPVKCMTCGHLRKTCNGPCMGHV